MRGVVQEEYSDPMSILSDYLEAIQGNMLWVKDSSLAGGTASSPFAHRHPHGALMAHYDMISDEMFVLKKSFKNYCTKIGANSLDILAVLNQPQAIANGTMSRVVTDKNVRKVLGAGTDYAKAQSYCFVINMAHPEVTGGVDRRILSGEAGRPGPSLRLVT